MSVVDTNTWKKFKLVGADGLFSDYLRGKCAVVRNLLDGDVPYVGAVFSDRDNAVVRYVTPANDKQISPGNSIACVCDGAAIGTQTYQPDDFVGTTNLKILHRAELNKYTGLFLVSALNAACMQRRYTYFDKRNDTAFSSEEIMLPATPDGEPDWSYMESYMRTIMDREEVFAEHLASLMVETGACS